MLFKITFHVRRKYSVSITVRELKSRNRRSVGSGGFLMLRGRGDEGKKGPPLRRAGAPFTELVAWLTQIRDLN